jgi:hypothetical protein
MGPNSAQSQTTEIPVLNAPTPLWKRKILWVAILVLVLIAGAVVYGVSTSQKSAETEGETTTNGVFLYMPRNLELRLSESWESISLSGSSLPQQYSGALFALRKEDANCNLAYVRMPSNAINAYEGERAFMVNNSYTGDQYIGYTQGDAVVTAYPRGFLGGNHNWPSGNDDDVNYASAFVMYPSQEGTRLDSVCIKDMETIMGQLRRHFDPISLGADSNGILYIVSERVDDEEVDQVRFMPTGTTTAYSVMGLTATSRPQPQFTNNTLYVVVQNKLTAVDPFAKTSTPLQNIEIAEGETINSFWVEGSKLIYLAGVNCNEYMAKCDLGLYEYDLSTNMPRKLAEHLSYRNIIGYDPVAREILMTYVWADGSERSENSGVYQYASGQIQKVDSYESIQSRFVKSTATYDYVAVQTGRLVAPKEEILTREDRWPITYPPQP